MHKEARSIVQHYNDEVGFFASFLDRYMKYTSAYFLDDDDLDVAAQRMLDKLIDSSNYSIGDSILEIGPGWGSILRRFLERFGDIDYTGVSPSVIQNEYLATEFADKRRVSIITNTLESFQPESKFDRIFLVGSFCHLTNQHEQLKKLESMLSENGQIVIEDSFFLTVENYDEHACHPKTKFLQNDVFGYAHIPAIADFTNFVDQADLRLRSFEDTTDHYEKTIDIWISRLKQNRENFPNTSKFIKYLKIAQAGWNYTTSNYIAVLERKPRTRINSNSRFKR